ncbi:hypothetical protein [Nocardioides dongkuii]|uniref:hypothetical protein n=1 Tax=Nocardioides dongkuii TaxID=2760089 RepID=UPI0015F79C21|nr:hypothetical protein [Nocardioides dongkuii]
MNDTDTDRRMFELVAAEPDAVGPPDVSAITRRARRHVVRRRAAAGLGVLAVAATVVVGVAVQQDDVERGREAPPVSSPSPTATASPTATPARPEPGSVRLPGGVRLTGEYEQGEVVGEVVDLGRLGDHEEVLYAARGSLDLSDPGASTTYVAAGVRVDDRILRTMPVAWPGQAGDEPDQATLYDGHRIDMYGFRDPYYRLFGLARGQVAPTIELPDGRSRATTLASTEVLPGWTVFVDEGPWDPAWDALQAVPAVLDLGDGRELDVRERTWTG